jgi:Flp pilus assembly protein TadD
LAVLLDKEGKSNEAKKQYEEAKILKPNDAKIHHNMGINLKRAGKLDEALQYYKKALDLEPDNSVVLYNTGILYNIKVILLNFSERL